jgi:hypothetical protein
LEGFHNEYALLGLAVAYPHHYTLQNLRKEGIHNGWVVPIELIYFIYFTRRYMKL